MKKPIKLEINNEIVYIKKGFLGWNIVYPNKIDGKINWKHLIAGRSWWNLLLIALITLIVLGCVWEYSHAASVANECLNTLNNTKIIIP